MLPFYELIDAIKRDSVDEVKAALAKGANPNGRDIDGLSPLQAAEKFQANTVVSILVQAGADVAERLGPRADRLLHLAARRRNYGFSHALLNVGALAEVRNSIGESPLHIAARTGQTYLAKLLVQHQANVLGRDAKNRSAIDIARDTKHSEIVQFLKPLVDEALYHCQKSTPIDTAPHRR